MMHSLEGAYKIKFKGSKGRCAHEFILDCSEFKDLCGVTETDIAKRLIDFGFHAPTMSWPVAGGIMIEPTESEDLYEMNRYIHALLTIRQEIQEIIDGKQHAELNTLKLAPFTLPELMKESWEYSFSREKAGYPAPWLHDLGKVFPTVARIDDAYGDRHLNIKAPEVSEFFKYEDGIDNEPVLTFQEKQRKLE